MTKRKMLCLMSLAGLLTLVMPPTASHAAWMNTNSGRIYTQTGSPGYVTGWRQIDNKWYYFNANGIMQTGFVTVDNKTYYLGSDGVRRTGWVTYGDNHLRYYFDKDGVMLTGFQKINLAYVYFNEKGVMQRGWFNVDGKTYCATQNGVLYMNRWVGDYYFQADGSLAKNMWISGKWVGNNGKYTGVRNNIGWVTDGGNTYFYDENSRLVKGWLHAGGKTYYLNPTTGALVKGWFRVGSQMYYASMPDGSLVKNAWRSQKYLQSDGSMAVGWTTISGKTFLFKSDGLRTTGWVKYNDKYYYLNKNGVMQKNTWVEGTYLTADGSRASGMTNIGNYTYYLNPSTGVRMTGYVYYNGNHYYFNTKTGALHKNQWIGVGQRYYASNTGAFLKGLNAVGGSIYYFNPTTGRKLTASMQKIGSDTYYFTSTGAAVRNVWVKLNSKFYYFQSSGKMAVSTWVGKYYVDATGARTTQQKKTGWQTIDGNKYYFDNNGNMMTGWQTISGEKYFFNTAGVMQTGIQSIGNVKHYFYADGHLATSITIAVGTKQYTINSSGVIVSEVSIKVTGDTKGVQIVNFALQYVGYPYVYGGTSLTKGADCSGFVQTVFSHFGYKLLRVADDQMHGPSASNIKSYGYTPAVTVDLSSIQPGDLLFYGSGNYASHVAIYIGNGKIVHASNSQPYPKGGIKISNYDYSTPLKAVRYWF